MYEQQFISKDISLNIGKNGKFSQTPSLLFLLCWEDPDQDKNGLRYFVKILRLLKGLCCVSYNSLGRRKCQERWWQGWLAEPGRGCFSMVGWDSCRRVDCYYSAVVPYNLHLVPLLWLPYCPWHRYWRWGGSLPWCRRRWCVSVGSERWRWPPGATFHPCPVRPPGTLGRWS